MTVRVAIADDHPMFRFGLRAVLEQSADIEVVAEAADGEQLLALVADARPAVVLTDLSMQGLDGVQVIESLSQVDGGPAVIALTMHGDDQHIGAAIRAGARGYLLKGADAATIIRAVHNAAAGQDTFDRAVTRRLVAAYETAAQARSAFPELTEREYQVLELIAIGCANHEIARRLRLADKTVRNLTSAVLLKLGAPDRTAAALRAQRAGLGESPQ